MMIVFGLVAARRAGNGMTIDGVSVNGLDIGELTSRMSASDMAEFAQGIDLTLFLSSSWPFIVLAFVVFFYCLGALYDERKDRRDRKSDVWGKSVSVRVDLGGRRFIKQK